MERHVTGESSILEISKIQAAKFFFSTIQGYFFDRLEGIMELQISFISRC